MAKITLHGMFARVMGKFNRSETLYFKRCTGGKKTLKAWYWMVECAAYDQEHGN